MCPCEKHLQIQIRQVAVCCWENWFSDQRITQRRQRRRKSTTWAFCTARRASYGLFDIKKHEIIACLHQLKKNPLMHPQYFSLCCLAMSLHLCKSHRVLLSSSAVPWLAPCCCTGGPVILGRTLPPGHTHRQPQLAHLLSHSTQVVSIGHTPVPAVSACQPASLWAPDAFYAPSDCQGAITSPQRRRQFLHRDHTEFRHIQVNRTQIFCTAFNFSVYVHSVPLLLSRVHAGVVRGFRCLRVLLGFHSPACCLPPFAIQMSAYEAIQWGRSSPLLLCVSLKTIIPRTCKLTLPFLMHLSIGTSEQVVSPLSERIFRWPFHRTHSVFCICLKLLTLAWSAVWLCGVTFMWPMMTPRQATGHVWVSAVLCLCCHCCWPSWTFFDPPQCFYSLVSVVTSPPACWTTVTSHTGTHTHAFILLYFFRPIFEISKTYNIT